MMIVSPRATLLSGISNNIHDMDPIGGAQTGATVAGSKVRVGPEYQAEIPARVAFDGCRECGEKVSGEEQPERPCEWSSQEKEAFLLALTICGKEFRSIASFVGTKTVSREGW
jgi:hypothetical protein